MSRDVEVRETILALVTAAVEDDLYFADKRAALVDQILAAVQDDAGTPDEYEEPTDDEHYADSPGVPDEDNARTDRLDVERLLGVFEQNFTRQSDGYYHIDDGDMETIATQYARSTPTPDRGRDS